MFVLLGATILEGCTCIAPTVRNARKRADIVFRGRIIGLRDTDKGQRVIFAVDRVWKGKVPSIFEMAAIREAAVCIGFWPSFLETGNYLLVYAYEFGDPPEYMTDICSRTNLVDHSEDFARLGKGYQPISK